MMVSLRTPSSQDEGDPIPSASYGRPAGLRSGLLILAGVAAVIAIGVLALSLRSHWPAVMVWFARARWPLVALHLALIALLWLRWPQVVRWMYRKRDPTPQTIASAIRDRNRVALLLLLLEAVFVLQWPMAFFKGA